MPYIPLIMGTLELFLPLTVVLNKKVKLDFINMAEIESVSLLRLLNTAVV
jgi:hypothetical protein